jgi:hypothetical protein
MNQTTITDDCFESTYALLMRSEEKERNLFEAVAYLIFILSAVFSIWYTAQGPIDMPIYGAAHTTSVTQPNDTLPNV